MKNFIKSFRITIAFCIFFSVFYILVLWIFAQFAGRGENGNAETVTLNGKVVGAANVGQMFTSDVYFWGRPQVLVTVTMLQVLPVPTKVLPMRNIWQRWRLVWIPSLYTILI